MNPEDGSQAGGSVDQLMQVIRQLQERIRQLESQLQATRARPSAPQSPADKEAKAYQEWVSRKAGVGRKDPAYYAEKGQLARWQMDPRMRDAFAQKPGKSPSPLSALIAKQPSNG